MSFDHDAAGERGVARQKVIDGLYHQLYGAAEDFYEDNTVDPVLAEFHIVLITYLMSGGAKPALFPAKYRNEVFAALDDVRDRVRCFALDDAEYRMMLLTLSQKLYASATSKIISAFAMWESEHFQERASA